MVEAGTDVDPLAEAMSRRKIAALVLAFLGTIQTELRARGTSSPSPAFIEAVRTLLPTRYRPDASKPVSTGVLHRDWGWDWNRGILAVYGS